MVYLGRNNRITLVAKQLAACAHFLWAGLTKRRQTGALLPSQRFLVDRMIAPISPTYRGRIVELGAGNGALTRRLAVRCPAARILACEINPALANENRQLLQEVEPNGRVVVSTDTAENLLARMRDMGERLDYVVSGLPLAVLSRPQTWALLEAIYHVLADGGTYIQFQYSLLDRKKIRATFRSVRTVPVLLNVPPAVVYFAQK